MAMQRLKEAAEKAQVRALQRAARRDQPAVHRHRRRRRPLHLNYALTREQLEELVDDLVERPCEPCRNALEAAGLKPADVDQVILVGGQTRMPLVARTVAEFFGRDPDREINPDEVVAVGAAIQGGDRCRARSRTSCCST